MQLIAHRGFWNENILPNSYESFVHAFENGYGIETDFRDFDGELVVSHDPPTQNNFVTADAFFKLAAKYPTLPLAINIKADGLQLMLKKYLNHYNITNYFVFDMSIPDMYRYKNLNLPYYGRLSEYEKNANPLHNAAGVWLDGLHSEWYSKEDMEHLMADEMPIAIVSAELHKRNYDSQWSLLLSLQHNIGYQNLFLCTDFPDQAKQFFNL